MRKIVVISLTLLLLSACASPRPWTRQEKIAGAYFTLAHFADCYTTNKMLNSPINRETNPILGDHPENSTVNVYFSISGIAILLVGHWWPDARKPLFIGCGTLGAGLAAHNSTLD